MGNDVKVNITVLARLQETWGGTTTTDEEEVAARVIDGIMRQQAEPRPTLIKINLKAGTRTLPKLLFFR